MNNSFEFIKLNNEIHSAYSEELEKGKRTVIPMMLTVSVILIVVDIICMDDMLLGVKVVFNSFATEIMATEKTFLPTYKIAGECRLGAVLAGVTMLWILAVISIAMRYLEMRIIPIAIIAATTALYTWCGYEPVLVIAGMMLLVIGRNKLETIAIAAVYVVSFSLAISSASDTNEWTETSVKWVKATINEMRYGSENARSMQQNIGRNSYTKQKKMEDNVALEVQMDVPQPYYLKGFVGNKYNGKWQESDGHTVVEYADQFYWMHKGGFYGYGQIAQAAESMTGIANDTNTITVNNVSASTKYCYVPYELVADNANIVTKNKIGDEVIESNENKYSFEAVNNILSTYPDILKNYNNTTDYAQMENCYSQYVYSVGLDVDEGIRRAIEEQFGEFTNDRHADYKTVKEGVIHFTKEYLSKDDEDTAYATAAVMVFRYFGIPARYVEGYIITKEDVADIEPGETIAVKQSSWHGWCEYYQDGVGFIPFECAPEYIDIMDRAEEIVDTDSVVHDNQIQIINKDNYRKAEESIQKTDNPVTKRTWMIIAVIVLVGIIAAIAVALRPIIIRRSRIKGNDNNIAIREMFSHTVRTLYRRGICTESSWAQNVEELKQVGMSEQFTQMLAIYQKARFGKGQCSDEERNKVNKLAYIMLKRRIIRCEEQAY